MASGLGLVKAMAVRQLGYGSSSGLIQVLVLDLYSVHKQAHSTLTVCVSVAYWLIGNVCTVGTLFFGGKSTLHKKVLVNDKKLKFASFLLQNNNVLLIPHLVMG